MNDKELLELAAKAAGYEIVGDADSMVVQHNRGMGAFVVRNDRGGDSIWNPLTDDGDALRLAVNLGLDILVDDNTIEVNATRHSFEEGTETVAPWAWEALGDDPYAATRRAIVRAAAEIGRRMQTLKS